MARDFYSTVALYVIITISLAALSYLIYIVSSVFSDPYDENKPLVLDMTGTPMDVAKRYFKTNPYVTIGRSGRKVLCRDGGRDRNVCSNISYLNTKVSEILKSLNSASASEQGGGDGGRCKQIRIETHEEFLHHVLVEIALVLFQMMDLGLDSGTKFCEKKILLSGDGFVTICNLTTADSTKED
jgi:hypothetical protein